MPGTYQCHCTPGHKQPLTSFQSFVEYFTGYFRDFCGVYSWIFFFFMIVSSFQASMGFIAVRVQTPAVVALPRSFAAMAVVWTRWLFKAFSTIALSFFRQEEASPASVTRGGQQDPVHQLVKWTWTNVLLDRHPAPGIPWWRASMCLGPSTVVLAPLGTLEMASTALMRMNAGQDTEGAVSVQGWNASTPVVVIIVGPVRLDILGMGGLADTSGHVTFPMEVVTHWPLALSRLAWSGASALLAMEV